MELTELRVLVQALVFVVHHSYPYRFNSIGYNGLESGFSFIEQWAWISHLLDRFRGVVPTQICDGCYQVCDLAFDKEYCMTTMGD